MMRDLAVYDTNEPPTDFSIATELDALDRAADAAGFKRFHLYGHSGGGAVALAYAATRGDRLTSLGRRARVRFHARGQQVDGWRSSTKLCASAGRTDLADRDRWPYLIPMLLGIVGGLLAVTTLLTQ